MSLENVEIATRAIDAWNRCDLAAFLQEWHPACEWRPAFPKGTEGTGSVFRGHAGITTAWRAVRVAWTVYRLDVDEARSVGDELLVLGNVFARGASSGIELESPWGAVVGVRDGRLISAWDWLSRDEALEAVGLAE
jgi:ketosteroid isomerase-like protein